MNGDHCKHHCGHTPLSRETQDGICPGIKVGSRGDVLDNENSWIFFSFNVSFRCRATLPHTGRVIVAYPSPDPTHQKNSKLPREFKRHFRLMHRMDRQMRRHSQIWDRLGAHPAAFSIHPSRSLLIVSVRLLIILSHMQVTRYLGKLDWMHTENTAVLSRTECIRRSVKKSGKWAVATEEVLESEVMSE